MSVQHQKQFFRAWYFDKVIATLNKSYIKKRFPFESEFNGTSVLIHILWSKNFGNFENGKTADSCVFLFIKFFVSQSIQS